MKPAPFDYVAPRSLEEALAALAAGGDEAKVLAGGQSLIPLLNFRLARPALLVDLNRVPELAYVTPRDNGVAIGAMTRQVSVERHPELARTQPLLIEAIGWVGHTAIRSRGTVGGSLAHADPAAELPAVAVCLDAQLGIRGPRGHRTVSAEQFFIGYLSTVLEPDELLVEAWLPPLQPITGQVWLEYARRHGDFALAGVAVSMTLEQERVTRARIVLTGVGGQPVRVLDAEAALVGRTGPDAAADAADAVRARVEPDSDMHASKEYRTQLAAVLTERAVRLAYSRAQMQPAAALDVRRALETLARHA